MSGYLKLTACDGSHLAPKRQAWDLPPPPDFGASIDAWDESTNGLIDDTFVTVDSPTGPLTELANVEGWVDTPATAETITALQLIVPTGQDQPDITADFDQWVEIDSRKSPAVGNEFNAAQGTSYIALAFYKPPVTQPPKPCQTSLLNYNKTLNEPTPVAVLESFLKEFSTCRGQLTVSMPG